MGFLVKPKNVVSSSSAKESIFRTSLITKRIVQAKGLRAPKPSHLFKDLIKMNQCFYTEFLFSDKFIPEHILH